LLVLVVGLWFLLGVCGFDLLCFCGFILLCALGKRFFVEGADFLMGHVGVEPTVLAFWGTFWYPAALEGMATPVPQATRRKVAVIGSVLP